MLLNLKPYYTHYRSLTHLGVPIIIGQIGTIVLGFADTLMIGRHSTQELAAAAFVNNMFVLVLIFAMGFSYGLTPIVGSLYGREEHGKIGGMLKNSLVANTLLALGLVVIMTILYLNLGNLGQPEELLPLMRPYFIVNLISLPFVSWFNTFKQLSDGTTDTKTPMWILLGGNLLNIVGNYVLIYGKVGFPELGLYGAGLSTMFSRIVMALVFAYVFLCTKRFNSYKGGFFAEPINGKDISHLCRIGFPLSIQMGMETAAFSLSSIMVGWIGAMALAAHQVMLTISQFFYMVYYGMGSAVAVRVSYFTGQHDYKAVSYSASAGFHLILLIAFAVSVPVVIWRDSLGVIFTDSSEVCEMVGLAILPLIVYQFGDGMQCAYGNALRGLSYVQPLMYTAFIAYFVISLPLGYFLGIYLEGGLLGIWFAFPFGLTTAGFLYYWYFRKRLKEVWHLQR
ncbi:MATE family efflux transporter [Prevotella sp. HUN102]|uniref:MATE family efflux transporter n=1 Tax=Prevotella sp. HUN102 TaxID=1392486 RepID=UPI00048E1ED4|nr:MATE family efflux transporter [Prevotella sp. HUN102]